MNRWDLQELAKVRLAEARALFDAGLFDGAYYLAGYAVECALKACIARETREFEFPDKKRVDASHTHSLRELITVAGLSDDLSKRLKADARFEEAWEAVRDWSEKSRYERYSAKAAHALLEAVENPVSGMMAWLTPHW